MSHVFTTPPTLSPTTLPPTRLRLVTPRPEAVSTAHPSTTLLRGDALFKAGRLTTPCRIITGAVRLDPATAREGDVLLALPGDLLGLDALLGEPQSSSARAIVTTTIEPLTGIPDLAWRGLLARGLIAQQNRSAELSRLRIGSAAERLRFLLMLLAGRVPLAGTPTPVDASGDARCELPTLADISDITGAAPETMCRVISAMRRSSMLNPVGPRWVRLGAALLADTQALPEGMTRSRTREPMAVPAH